MGFLLKQKFLLDKKTLSDYYITKVRDTNLSN